MTRYHWWIFTVAALGWLFDTMDQTLFRLSRQPAVTELLAKENPALLPGLSDEQRTEADNRHKQVVKYYSGIATAIFLAGWATGGLIFGILGDRWGRARTMLITIILYSIFTGLSALSTNIWDYSAYRFLTGLGVGGEFAAGVALVSETLPNRARPVALGLLQALSAVGNISGAILFYLLPAKINIGMKTFFSETGDMANWRLSMVAGMLPALLVIAVRRRLDEPESWKQARARAKADGPGGEEMGSLTELFGDARWRKNVLLGIALAMSGVVAVWGVGFWTPELLRDILKELPKAEQDRYVAIQDMLQQVGAFFGMLGYTWMATTFGRKPAFFLSYLMSWGMATSVFLFMDELSDMYWMIPMLGFCMMTIFGGYAIYFPELFPTRLRSTGTGFCYNVARYLAAAGPFVLGGLTVVFADAGFAQPFRYAAVAVLFVNVVGLIAILFCPETKDKALPT
ncbi:MFS transporter [bacterium]|nr:MFS transporter [bacterium]